MQIHYNFSNTDNINISNESNILIEKNVTPKHSFSNSFSTNSNSSAELCRICYLSEKKEELIHPCKCSGTMGLIHKTCLEKWLSSSNTNECEICHYKFTVKRKTRPFYQWFVRPVSIRDHKNLLGDLICFFVLTPLAVISAWLCILGALRYQQWENKWEAFGLVILTCFLLFIYLTWCTVSIKYHVKVFKDWQSQNHIVSLNMSNNSNNKNRNRLLSSLNRNKNKDNNNNNNNNNIIMNPDITTTPTTTITNHNSPNLIKLNNLNNQLTNLSNESPITPITQQRYCYNNDGMICIDLNCNNQEDELQQQDDIMNITHVSNDSTLPFVNI